MLNADLKQHETKAAPPRNKIALTRTAIGALRSIQKQSGRVESNFGKKDVVYAASLLSGYFSEKCRNLLYASMMQPVFPGTI